VVIEVLQVFATLAVGACETIGNETVPQLHLDGDPGTA